MAEGGFDPTNSTTDKTPLIPDTGDDDNDDAPNRDNTDLNQIPAQDYQPPDDTDSSQNPFEPGAASTPAGEQIPMVTRARLQQGAHTDETNFGGGDDSQEEIHTKMEREAGRQLTMTEAMAFKEARDEFKQANLNKIDVKYVC